MEEPTPRYLLPGKKIGLPNRALYFQTLIGAALWLGWPWLVGRLLGRLHVWNALYAMERWWARGISRYLRIRLDIEGLEHINRNEAYVVTPLHESCADPLAILHLPLNLRFVVRDEFFGWRWLGPYLRDTGRIAINPEQGSRSYRQILRAARAVFDAGESLAIFPQGSVLGIETDFLPGAFALARFMRRPILPVALTGGHRVWEYPFSPRLHYGQRISLRVLAPISVEECLAREVDDLRADVQRRLKAEALSGTMAAPRHFIPSRDGFWDGYVYRIDPNFEALAAEVARHQEVTLMSL